jgi:hypothetical protein
MTIMLPENSKSANRSRLSVNDLFSIIAVIAHFNSADCEMNQNPASTVPISQENI